MGKLGFAMKKFLAVLVLGFAVAIAIAPAVAQDAPAPVTMRPVPDAAVKDVFDGLVGAITDDNYSSFLLLIDENFRAALPKPAFESVVKQVGPRFETGSQATYFGQLGRNGYAVHLWKIEFDTGDDLLAEVSLKDGKVGGFFLR